MDASNSVVPDPKSGRDSSPQNTNAVQTYIWVDGTPYTPDEITNELKQARAELTRVRQAMSDLQSQAAFWRRKVDFVPEDLREGLRASRRAHRALTRTIKELDSLLRSTEEEE